MKRPRINDWLTDRRGDNLPKEDVEATVASFKYLLGALRSRAPGQWSANLLELSRHMTSAVYLAVNTIATQAAAAEAQFFERTPDPDDGDLELHWDEPLVRLWNDPNNDDSSGDLLYQITQQLSLTGVALVWMPQLSGLDVPSELYVISSASALPWPPSPIHPHGSYLIQPYYPYGPFSTVPSYQSAAGARIPAEQIIRIKNHHPYLRYDGYAVLTALNRQIDTIDQIDLARWNTQSKGVDPTLSIEFDPAVLDPAQTDMERLRNQLESLYAGPLGKKFFFNPVGTKLNPISHTPAEMAWQEGWSQLTDFVLACYGVPKSVAGLQDDASYATLYSSLKQFYVLSLNPLLRKIADKFTKHLVCPFFGDDLYMSLKGQKITDDDLLEKQLATNISAGNVMKVDEFRKERGWRPLGGKKGEAFVGGGKGQAQQPPMPGMPETMDQDQADLLGTRPDNDLGAGSLPPRFGPGKRYDADRMATILERFKSAGAILPLEYGRL